MNSMPKWHIQSLDVRSFTLSRHCLIVFFLHVTTNSTCQDCWAGLIDKTRTADWTALSKMGPFNLQLPFLLHCNIVSPRLHQGGLPKSLPGNYHRKGMIPEFHGFRASASWVCEVFHGAADLLQKRLRTHFGAQFTGLFKV